MKILFSNLRPIGERERGYVTRYFLLIQLIPIFIQHTWIFQICKISAFGLVNFLGEKAHILHTKGRSRYTWFAVPKR